MKAIGSIVGAFVIAACGEPDAGEHDVGGSSSGAETKPDASSDGDAGETSGGAADGPTYHRDIAPIVRERCGGCHVEGGIAPFPLETYAEVAPLAPIIAVVVENRTMPPWHAVETEECQPPLGFLHDPRLRDEEIDAILDWADAGAPQGDPATATALPPAPDLSLAEPSGEFLMPTATEVDGVEDQFVCFSIDLGLDRDVWITGAQLSPSNRSVVHHVLVYTDENAESVELAGPDGSYECFGGPGIANAPLFGAYIPGALPIEMPAGTGVRLQAGGRVVLGFHFHPTGQGAEVDQSTLALRWTESPPEHSAQFKLIGNFQAAPDLLSGVGDRGEPEFRIPAGSDRHVETMEWTVPTGSPTAQLFAIGNHMHYIGVDMRVEIERANGTQECLLQTPDWDFGWQRAYFYDGGLGEFPSVAAGDTVRLRCTYDNSLANDALVDALAEQGLDHPIDVQMGESTLEEMCLVGVGLAW